VRILLDECLPRQLARELIGHDVQTVTQAGWSSIQNGELLRLAAGKFDVFVTIDRRFARDNRPPPSLAIISLTAPNNRVETLRKLVPEILRNLPNITPGKVIKVGV